MNLARVRGNFCLVAMRLLTQELGKASSFFAWIMLKTTYRKMEERERDLPCESGGKPRSSRAPCRHSPFLLPFATFSSLIRLARVPMTFNLMDFRSQRIASSASKDWQWRLVKRSFEDYYTRAPQIDIKKKIPVRKAYPIYDPFNQLIQRNDERSLRNYSYNMFLGILNKLPLFLMYILL